MKGPDLAHTGDLAQFSEAHTDLSSFLPSKHNYPACLSDVSMI